MESSTSHNERYIIVPNVVIRSIGELGGVDTFRLYAEILLHKNWRNELATSPNLLLGLVNRSKQYWQKKLKSQLLTLVENGIIRIDRDLEGLGINEHLCINTLQVSGAATQIKCVNTAMFELPSTVSVNILFSVFAYISMCVNRDVGFARVSKETIANGLGLDSEGRTVYNATKNLEENGFVHISRGIFHEDKGKYETNKYYVHDYNSLGWKVKHGLASFPERQELSKQDESVVKIERAIVEVMSNPAKFSPCVFKGLPAKFFKEYYDTLGYDCLFLITTIAEMTELVNGYEGILDVDGGVIAIYFERLTEGIENYLVAFVKGTTIPIILLLGNEVEIANNQLKSLVRYVYS